LNAYVDSSVVLRIVLSEPKRLRGWSRITTPVASELIRLECLRTIDRARLRLSLKGKDVANHRSHVLELLESFNLVAVDGVVLDRAAEPFPTMLGSLDAIHLASAVLAREEFDDLILATHDDDLAIAARAVGFEVQGSSA
jgi:uncharacterized protein